MASQQQQQQQLQSHNSSSNGSAVPSNDNVSSSARGMFLECSKLLLSPSTQPDVRKQADTWLAQFQYQAHAWAAVDQVLRDASLDENILFLAAQTLNRKIRYDREQLGEDAETWNALRQAVVSHLLLHAHRPVVLTQLSLGLVALVIQMETWNGAFKDLVQLLYNKPAVLFEVLQLIPEEVDDPSLDVSAKRRFAFKTEMIDVTSQIVSILVELKGSLSATPHCYFNCTRSWIFHSDVEGVKLAESGLLQDMLVVLGRNSERGKDFEAAVELAIETVHRYHTLDNDDVPVLRVVVPGIFGLAARFEYACAAKDEIVVLGLARVFSHLCEANIPLMLGPDEVQQISLASLALRVFSHDDARIAGKALYFWLDFLMALGRLEPPNLRATRLAQFSPMLQTLVDVCVKRMTRNPNAIDLDDGGDSDSDDGADDLDDGGEGGYNRLSEFEEHRLDVGDVLRNLMLASAENADANFVGTRLGEICKAAVAAQPSSDLVVEAVIVAFRSIAHELCWTSRDSVNGRVIETMLLIGMDRSRANDRVCRATCDLIVELSEHIAKNPDTYLKRCVLFLIESLRANGARCARHASHCLRRLCHTRCAPLLARDLEELMQMISPFDAMFTIEDVRLNLVDAVALVWAYMDDEAEFMQTQDEARVRLVLQRLCEPPLQLLSNALLEYTREGGGAGRASSATASSVDAMCFAIHALGGIVRFSRSPQRAQQQQQQQQRQMMNNNNNNNAIGMPSSGRPKVVEFILDKVLPMLGAFNALPEKAIDALCGFVKHAMRNYGYFVRVNIRVVLEFINTRYGIKPVSSLLYLTGVLFQEYHEIDEFVDVFPHVLTSLCRQTFEQVLSSAENFVAFPNYVEDVFYLGRRAAEYLPRVIIQTEAFELLFRTGVHVGILVEHREAFRSVATFFESAIGLGILSHHSEMFRGGDERFRPAIAQLLDRYGGTLMANLLQGATGVLSQERVFEQSAAEGTICHVLFSLLEFWDEAKFTHALNASLQLGMFSFISNETKGMFQERVLQAANRGGLHDFCQACVEFSTTASRRRMRKI